MRFAKKSLGQNFLIDKNIIKKIVNCAKIKDRDIIEIGPGKASLTNEILKQEPKSLIVIEKDDKLFKNLKKVYTNNKLVKVLNKDILKFDVETIVKKNSLIIGNLPYNISSQILVKILKFKKWPPNYMDIIFMFQKELGEKIMGKYMSSNYGRLSIIANYRLKVMSSFLVSNNCFFPKPKVTSQVIHFKPREDKIKIKNLNNLEKVTNIIFSNKRKMINKSLRKLLNLKKLSKIPQAMFYKRPTDLEAKTYYKIANLYEN